MRTLISDIASILAGLLAFYLLATASDARTSLLGLGFLLAIAINHLRGLQFEQRVQSELLGLIVEHNESSVR